MNTTLVFRGSRAPELTEGVVTTLNNVLIKGDLSGIKNSNDWLNNFSQGLGEELSMTIPDAPGIKTLSGGAGTMLDRHGIAQAIQCIEDQKDDDISVMRSRT